MRIDIHDFPGKTYRIDSPYRAAVSQDELAGLASEAIELFYEDFVILPSADLALSYSDAQWSFPTDDPGPEQAYWSFHTENMPPQEEHTDAWIGAHTQKFERIDGDRLFDSMSNAMAWARADNPALDDSVLIGWREILIRAVQVRLPGAVIEPGRLSLDINIFWPLWTQPENPGYAHTQDALKRRQSSLWLCTSSCNEPPKTRLKTGTHNRPDSSCGKPNDAC